MGLVDTDDPHPIDPSIRDAIERELTQIEQQHDVRILFACESGSRGWGFASPDSDYDVRFLYVHRLNWYLKVHPGRDVIELPISDVLDISGWDLRKALSLLLKGNATLIEWLDSPVIYRCEPQFLAAIRALLPQVYRPERSLHHYLHMARKNHREYLRGDVVRLKKYLYVLRPLLAARWVCDGRGIPPMRFQDLVDGLIADSDLLADIAHLLAIKRRASEAEHGAAIPGINAYIAKELASMENLPDLKEHTRADAIRNHALVDQLMADTVLQPQ